MGYLSERSFSELLGGSGAPSRGRSLRLIWHWTLDPRPHFTPNRSVGRTIPDYFGASQCVEPVFRETATTLCPPDLFCLWETIIWMSMQESV